MSNGRPAIFKATIAKSLRGDARATAMVLKLMDYFKLAEADAAIEQPRIQRLVRIIIDPKDGA